MDCNQSPRRRSTADLHEEVEIAVAVMKKGRSAELTLYQQKLFRLAGRS